MMPDFFIPAGLGDEQSISVQQVRSDPALLADEPGYLGVASGDEIGFVEWVPSMRDAARTVLGHEQARDLFERPTGMVRPELANRSRGDEFNPRVWLNDARVYWLASDVRPADYPQPVLRGSASAGTSPRTKLVDGWEVTRRWAPAVAYYSMVALVVGAIGFAGVKYHSQIAAAYRSATETADVPSATGSAGSGSVDDGSLPSSGVDDSAYPGYYAPDGCEKTLDEYDYETWGDGYESEEECLQAEWENHEGASWTAFTDAFDSAAEEGCQSLFTLTDDGYMYSDDYKFSEDDCSNISPSAADSVAPMEIPYDPENEGGSLGFEAGCDAIFEWMEYDEVYWGEDYYTVDDCYGQNPY